MILIEYGFVIAGSEIRKKKEFFYIASFISFCLGGFPVSRFFHIENVVVVGSKKVVKTDDIYLLLSLLQFVGDVGMKLVMHFHQSSNIFGVDSKSLLLQVGSSCQGGRDVRLDRGDGGPHFALLDEGGGGVGVLGGGELLGEVLLGLGEGGLGVGVEGLEVGSFLVDVGGVLVQSHGGAVPM